MRLYQNAQIARENSPDLETSDVLVDGSVIREVGQQLLVPDGAEVIDCAGKIIIPSMFDVHVHGREPGQEAKETIASAAEAAINGGVTGIVLMPNTEPAIDSSSMVTTVLEKGRATPIEVLTAGCITKGRKGERMAGIAGMRRAGAVFLTDDMSPVSNPQLLRRAMEYAREFDLFFANHCEIPELSADGAMNEGRTSYSLGIPGLAAISEEICLHRDIRIAQCAGAHVHIQHVTTVRGMEMIRGLKKEGGKDGFRVSCEVSPHHLIFNERDIRDYDTNFKMNPPLRTQEDNEQLLAGLIDGVFDVISTGHAPHTEFEKNTDFVSAPFGITGLETAVVSLFHHFIKPGKFGWDVVVKHYSAEPRRLVKKKAVSIEKDQPAEFLVFDPTLKTRFTKNFMRSKSSNTPYIDQVLDGQVIEVVYGGDVLLRR
ncbi:MAG: dihydroorotase [Verrucomicrobiales bacterium]|jgi:dihydroorotase